MFHSQQPSVRDGKAFPFTGSRSSAEGLVEYATNGFKHTDAIEGYSDPFGAWYVQHMLVRAAKALMTNTCRAKTKFYAIYAITYSAVSPAVEVIRLSVILCFQSFHSTISDLTGLPPVISQFVLMFGAILGEPTC